MSAPYALAVIEAGAHGMCATGYPSVGQELNDVHGIASELLASIAEWRRAELAVLTQKGGGPFADKSRALGAARRRFDEAYEAFAAVEAPP